MLPIYVVSLKRDVARRTVIQQKMDEFSLSFIFIDAVEGRLLSAEKLEGIRQKSAGGILTRHYDATPGEVGCSLSHLNIYEVIQKGSSDWACILEDDAILDDRFAQFYVDFQNKQCELDTNNLYLLGGQNGLEHPLVFKSFVRKTTIGQQVFVKTIHSQEYIYRTCCYLMSQSMAAKLVELSESFFFIADDWAFLARQQIIQQIYLADFVDHPLDLSDSSIEKERQLNVQSTQLTPNISPSFLEKVRSKLSWQIRLLWLNISRFL